MGRRASRIGNRLEQLATTARKRQDEAASLFAMLVGFILFCLTPLVYVWLAKVLGDFDPDNGIYVTGMLLSLGLATWFVSSRVTTYMQRGRDSLLQKLRNELRGSDVQALAIEEEVWLRLREMHHNSWFYRWIIPDLPMTPEQQLRAAAIMHPVLLRISRGQHRGLLARSYRCLFDGMLSRLWVNDCLGCLIFPLLPLFMFLAPVCVPLLYVVYRCQLRENVTLAAYCDQLSEAGASVT